MSFKEFLLDVLDRTVNASWYRSVGCSPDEASFLADMEANTAFFKQSEKRNPSSALTERHCNCQKKNVIRNAPKPLRTSAQHQATLMRILPKKPKPMRDIPQFKRNFSGSTLPKPRWKSAAANCARKTHGYMKKPKNSGRKRFGSEKKQKNRDNDQSYSRGYAVSLRPQFSPFTAGNGIIKEGMCDESEGFSDRASCAQHGIQHL